MSAGTAADVRAWAEENGFEVPDKGRLPSAIKDAYAQAQAGAGDETEVTEGPPEAAAPPEFVPDPDPVRPKNRAKPKITVRAPKVDAATRRDIQAKVSLMAMLPVSMWARRDPYCGAVAMEQLPDISEALTDIFCDSPDLVVFFTSQGAGYMKWLKLATAVQPVVMVGYQHHIRHSIGTDERGGPGGVEYEPPDMSAYHAPAL